MLFYQVGGYTSRQLLGIPENLYEFNGIYVGLSLQSEGTEN